MRDKKNRSRHVQVVGMRARVYMQVERQLLLEAAAPTWAGLAPPERAPSMTPPVRTVVLPPS